METDSEYLTQTPSVFIFQSKCVQDIISIVLFKYKITKITMGINILRCVGSRIIVRRRIDCFK